MRVCERIDAHDKRVDDLGAKLSAIAEAEVAQAASLERTQTYLESAARGLDQAARTINATSEWQAWAQQEITANRAHSSGEVTATRHSLTKENWRLITVICMVVAVLAGLKAGGLL
jgi:hypothetical protein